MSNLIHQNSTFQFSLALVDARRRYNGGWDHLYAQVHHRAALHWHFQEFSTDFLNRQPRPTGGWLRNFH